MRAGKNFLFPFHPDPERNINFPSALLLYSSVGYGTQTPASLTGKAIGGVCAIVGVFILTLPVPIVVNSFASYYKNRLWRNEVAHKRRLRAQEQTRCT